jgi:signal transduction histidine kinase
VGGVTRRFLAAHGELLLVFGLGALAQVEIWLDATWAADRRELALVALAMTAVLFLRLRAPLLALALQVALIQVESALVSDLQNDPMGVVLLLMVALYSAGAHARGRALWAAAALAVVSVGVGMWQDEESLNLGGLLFFGFFLGGPFLAGLAIRVRRERERALAGERDERARAAVAEERTRIARELHDVVAHAVSVVVLQARGARHSLATDPEDARSAIDAIERTASQALGEMRTLLAMLRDGGDVPFAPQASLAHLDVLAREVRTAGLPVEIRLEGEPRELSAGLDASAYRIVQEALTNALRHAGPARATVTVRYGDEALEIEVADDGRGSTNGHSSGHGLIGMRERAAVFGGHVDAGPRAAGGYAVRARLPL